jgi:hypothetical protein
MDTHHDSLAEIEKRLSSVETIVFGSEKLRLPGLSSQIEELSTEIARLNETMQTLERWQSTVVIYLRIGLGLMGVLGVNGLREIGTALLAALS